MTQLEWSATKLGECSVFFDGDDCAGGLIRDAAIAEIARLRLTDEEREAVETGEYLASQAGTAPMNAVAGTLRSLLERLT